MSNKTLTSFTITASLAVLLTLSGCFYEGNYRNRIEGEGSVITETLDLDGFDGFIIQNSANVVLTQGKTFLVEVEAQKNIIDNLSTEVTGDIWKIRNIRPVWRTQKVLIRITMPEFDLIKISGSGNVSTRGSYKNLGDLELRISGSGDMDLDIDADDIYGRIGGSGSIRLSGKADNMDLKISGSGDFYTMELKASEANARISGSGSIRINVSDRLDANISGSGDIYYKGRPQLNTSISGSGNIHSR